jgi:hypothetical protein
LYDPNKFKTTKECSICFLEFDSDSSVTPLPCDIKHYFHTECIETWIKTKPSCPLCRHPVSAAELEQLAPQVSALLANLNDDD